MAMLEKQLFDDAVGGGVPGSAMSSNDVDYAGSKSGQGGSVRHRPSADTDEACSECGTVPTAISRSNTGSLSLASETASQFSGSVRPSSSIIAAHRDYPRTDNRSEGPPSPRTVQVRRSNSPVVGMRGDLHGAGGASEPIRGLAAFGSQGSISDGKTPSSKEHSRLSPRRPARDPVQNVCKCQQGTGGARGAGSNAGGQDTATAGQSSRAGGAAYGNSAHRGGGGGGTRASSGGMAPTDPGYRVLHWSELSHLTYMTMGAMCEIYSAEVDGVKVAVKIPRKDCEEPTVAEHDLEVELDVLKRVNHKHIIGLIGAGTRAEKPHRFLVLEFLELGTLADKLDAGSGIDGTGTKESTFLRRQKRTKRYQDFYMVTMLERSLELAMALEHLHHHMPETFVVHRDLKPDNVGFKADGTLKLFDFGLARVVKRRNRVNARYEMTGETGSMRYMAPEVVESLPYNEKVDVYAFGLLLWEMLEDRRVFDGMGVTDFYERVVNAGARPNLDPSWPQDLRKLISQCWHADVDRRPNFRTIAERLRALYINEKHSSKLCMSALNLNEDEHPKLKGGSAVNMLARSATTTNVVSPLRGAGAGGAGGGGPSSRTEIGKKGGVLRRSFSKIGRMLNPKKGGAKATLTHTAPEAYGRNGQYLGDSAARGAGAGAGYGQDPSELEDDAIYGEMRTESVRTSRVDPGDVRANRAQSDGMILRQSAKGRR